MCVAVASHRVVFSLLVVVVLLFFVSGQLQHKGGRGGTEEDGAHEPDGQAQGVHCQGKK